MLNVLNQIIERCAAGEAVALCVVVQTRGSTPQGARAKMLVTAAGNIVGTLGGGCVEAEVRQRAITLLQAGESKLLHFSLDHDFGWDDGLICGGVMDILVKLVRPDEVETFRTLACSLSQGVAAEFRLTYEEAGLPAIYRETLLPSPRLVIAGAGHVGQALAPLATTLGFQVDVIDDRADCASVERFPTARRRIVSEIEQALAEYPVDNNTFIVIVTRGQRHDGRALAAVINSPARYIGLIGSKRKIKTIFDDLFSHGVSVDRLLNVRAPVGLEIGAITPPEIALSIAAELVAVNRGRENLSCNPMKIDSIELRRWLLRKQPNPAVEEPKGA